MLRLARARKNVKTAARAGVVMLLLGSLVTGFGEPDDLVLGSKVAGTPTVSILGGAGSGQISGEIISLNTTPAGTKVVLSTTSGYVTIILADPMMTAGLGVGVIATFAGDYSSADTFVASQVVSNVLAGGDLTLGAPLTGSKTTGGTTTGPGGVVLGGALGGTGSSSSTSSGTSSGLTSTDCSSTKTCPKLEISVDKDNPKSGEDFKLTLEASDDDGIESIWWWATSTEDDELAETHTIDCKSASSCKKIKTLSTTDTGTIRIRAQARDTYGNLSKEKELEIDVLKVTPTPTGTVTACSSSQDVTFTPEQGNAVVGTSHQLSVTVTGSGNCSGKKVYVRIEGSGQDPYESSATVGSDNKATIAYTSAVSGTELIRVWLDTTANQAFDTAEPFMLGEVQWQTPTATPTATTGVTSQNRSQSRAQATNTPTTKATSTPKATPAKTSKN